MFSKTSFGPCSPDGSSFSTISSPRCRGLVVPLETTTMTSTRLFFTAGLVVCLVPNMIAAQQPSSFARDVKPFLARYCLECHNSQDTKGDLDLQTFEGLTKGGKNGPVLVPGKPEESRFVLLPEHKAKPHMPPTTAKQPTSSDVAVLRAWVAAGARDDSATIRTSLPNIQPRGPKPAPISALAFRPDGQLLAAAGHRE